MRLFDAGLEATGVIAVGQIATGVVAVGQLATGVIAVGQVARGVIAVGQLSLGVAAAGQIGAGILYGAGMVGIGAFGGGLIPLAPWGRVSLRSGLGRLRGANALRTRPSLHLLAVWAVAVGMVALAALVPLWESLFDRGGLFYVPT